MVTVENAATIPGDDGRQAAAERAKPTLPRARQEPETIRATGS